MEYNIMDFSFPTKIYDPTAISLVRWAAQRMEYLPLLTRQRNNSHCIHFNTDISPEHELVLKFSIFSDKTDPNVLDLQKVLREYAIFIETSLGGMFSPRSFVKSSRIPLRGVFGFDISMGHTIRICEALKGNADSAEIAELFGKPYDPIQYEMETIITEQTDELNKDCIGRLKDLIEEYSKRQTELKRLYEADNKIAIDAGNFRMHDLLQAEYDRRLAELKVEITKRNRKIQDEHKRKLKELRSMIPEIG